MTPSVEEFTEEKEKDGEKRKVSKSFDMYAVHNQRIRELTKLLFQKQQPVNVNTDARILLAPLNKREEVWLRAWTAVAGASDTKVVKIPNGWAKVALEEFDKQFPERPIV